MQNSHILGLVFGGSYTPGHSRPAVGEEGEPHTTHGADATYRLQVPKISVDAKQRNLLPALGSHKEPLV